MPPRTPLGEINANRPRGPELDRSIRGHIIGLSEGGLSQRAIAKRFNLARTTVQSTLYVQQDRVNNKSKPRPGQPKKHDARALNRILRFVRMHPKKTYAMVKAELDLPFSRDTLRRILEPHGIRKWHCAKRPFLSEEVALKRFEWVEKHKDWSKEEWSKIIFSDESSVERGKGGAREWAFRTSKQKWDPKFVETYKKGRDISIMVWGAIWIGGRSDLDIMVRDADGGGGFTANSYIATLERTMGVWLHPSRIFMQDNAPIHKAKKVAAWFEEWAINVLEWPPYSPDLNPIEHVWARMKQWIIEKHPELSELGATQEAYDALARAIVEAWDALDQDYIDGLIYSMDNRVNHVRHSKGWHTRY